MTEAGCARVGLISAHHFGSEARVICKPSLVDVVAVPRIEAIS